MSQTQLSATAAHPRLGREASSGLSRGYGRRAPLDRLRVVPTAIGQTGNGVFAVVCMVLLTAGLAALLMMNTALASGIYQMKALQAQSGTLTDTQEQLTQTVDDLRSPRTLADKAQALGMVPAKSMAFIRLSDGAVIGVAEPATAEQRLNVVTTPAVPPPAPAPAAPPHPRHLPHRPPRPPRPPQPAPSP